MRGGGGLKGGAVRKKVQRGGGVLREGAAGCWQVHSAPIKTRARMRDKVKCIQVPPLFPLRFAAALTPRPPRFVATLRASIPLRFTTGSVGFECQ
eukprot:1462410-Rhodomonas_salina.2